MSPLYFKLEPLYGKPAWGTYLVIQPNHHEREVHNAHPDKRVADSVAGDLLVVDRRRKYRMLAVQRFSDFSDPWFQSVPECLAWVAEWERENREYHRKWWGNYSGQVS